MIRSFRNGAGSVSLVLTVLGLRYATCSGKDRLLSCLSKPPAPLSQCSQFSQSAPVCSLAMPPLHSNARCRLYPGSDVARWPVPNEGVSWGSACPQYSPVRYTAPTVSSGPVWADPEIGVDSGFCPKFNALDNAVDRRSHEGTYRVENGYPLNPHGRTGITGRGLLGRWGPNHAADPIITRWKRDSEGRKVLHPGSKNPILQFVSIKRKDCGEWAIPGGMVDPGERVSVTLRREFGEEALNALQKTKEQRETLKQQITELFNSPSFQVYKGYVDDPRNTDNAWMETVAVNYHDASGSSVAQLPLEAGDDAGKVAWVEIDSTLQLYASHARFLEIIAQERGAHWE